MAGFNFEFTYSERQEPVVLTCLAAGRRRARKLGISWRWQHVSARQLRVQVDGNSRRTDLLGYRLERDLPQVAEGCPSDMTPTERERLGRGIADAFLRGRHVEQDGVMRLRGVADTRLYYPPYDFECPDYPGLHARLRITEDVLVAWNFAEVAPEVLLEELHTACELILEETVNRRSKRLSFAELVAKAAAEGVFLDHAALAALGEEEDPVALLTSLKDTRKNARHRGVLGAREWLDVHWEQVAMLLERTVSGLNRWGPPGDGQRWWTYSNGARMGRKTPSETDVSPGSGA